MNRQKNPSDGRVRPTVPPDDVAGLNGVADFRAARGWDRIDDTPAGPAADPAPAQDGVEADSPGRPAGKRERPRRRKARRAAAPVVAPAVSELVVNSIAKSYGRREVVRDVSLSVREGETVGLLGPNGAGKTTVFYMITGLIEPDHGEIVLDGFEITRLPMYRRARLGIGYLPQEASIFRGLTVAQNIRAVLELVERDRRRREADLDELLNEFGLERLRDSPATALSGGERRRVEIARALASRPAFMLLDEPFAGIDPIAVADIQTLVRHLTERGIGVLITDHNVRETLHLIDRAYIIADGKVLTEGPADAIVANADARRLYLGEQFRL